MVCPEYLKEFRSRWDEGMSKGMGGTIRKMLALDGKTQRGNGRTGQNANHIVSAVDNDGFCVGEVLVEDKSNEITAIPRLLDDVEQYFSEPALLDGCAHHRVVDKARSAVEVREYWQTQDTGWLGQRKEWAGLSSIVMTRNTIIKSSGSTTQTRYLISSLPLGGGVGCSSNTRALDGRELSLALGRHIS